MPRTPAEQNTIDLFVSQFRNSGSGYYNGLHMLIYGLGFDRFRRTVPDIATALGPSRPDEATLYALADEAELIASKSTQTIDDQHTISQVLLKRYCSPQPSSGEQRLRAYNLKWGQSKSYTPAQVGKVNQFVKIDSLRTELLWKEVEDQLGAALDAAEHPAILNQSQHINIIKDAIALHFIRSPRSKELSDAVWANLPTRARDTFGAIPGLAGYGPKLDDLASAWAQSVDSDTRYRFRIADLFDRCRQFAISRSLTILVPEAGEFCIGDIPVVTLAWTGQGIGAPFRDASTVLFPLGRHRLAALGQESSWRSVSESEVVNLNRWQVLNAQRYVYFHENAALDQFVRSIQSERDTIRRQ